MFDAHEVHWFERNYVKRVAAYLRDHFGKTLDDLALSSTDVLEGMHQNLHPAEFIENNKTEWGIHRLPSSIAGTAARRVAVPNSSF
jgi:hypothetical protein